VQLGQSAFRTFNIPPQPLDSALILFGRQSGRQVAADGTLLRGLSTQGVNGTMTVDDALRRLLAGTNLTFSGIGGATITLQRIDQPGGAGAVQLDPVQVQGFPVPSEAMIDNLPPPYAGGQVATGSQLGLLGNRGVMDTPFNQTSYTAKKTQDQQAKTVQDALVDDPSARTVRADTGPGSDSVRIRGFTVDTADVSYGGLYGMLPTSNIMAELAERVEVLKGPSAMLNGMQPTGAIGGAINIVPKRAPDEPLTQFTANYVSGAQFGGHVDLARRFGADKQFGIRFNGVFRDGETDIKWNTDDRALGVFGFDFRGERVRFAADFGYQYRYIGGMTGYLGLNNGVPLPWAPNVRSNPAGQPWGDQENKDLFGVFRSELDLADNVTAYAMFGAHDYRLRGLYSAGVAVTNLNGDAAASAPFNLGTYGTYRTAEAGLRAQVNTGPIGHRFALSATTYMVESGSGFVFGTPFATNIYNPTVIARPNLATPVVNKASTSQLTSIGIADTLSAAEGRIELTVGARLQQVSAANFNTTSGAQTSSYDQNALTPSVALVFKPWKDVSVYGNFIQGLQQGVIVQAPFTNAGEIFPPYKSTQYEAGIKIDWGRLTTTASLFQINQPSVITNVASNTQVLAGEQINQGLELNIFGEVTAGLRVLGGAMFLNPVLTQTQGGLTNGWIAPFSPTAQFNLAGEWDLPFAPGLTVNGRVIYTGPQYIDTTFPRRSLPEWTRFDLGARYAFDNPGAKGKLLVARFNVENVLDSNYWASGNGVFILSLGAPRTFRVSLTADF
jgi:iron complex outermembrane receptor protein